jgi:protocatechuate 3,4-dioxygenase beta subunit
MKTYTGNAWRVLAWAAVLAAPVALGSARDSRAAEVDAAAATTEGDADAKPPALQGRITDETGAPVTDATLELTGTKQVGQQGAQYFHTKTDENGSYRFDAVAAGDEFRLQISSVGWVGITKWREMPQLQLSPDATMERDFQLKRACRVTIRTLDESGQPIEGVRIYVTSLTADRFGGGTDGVSTDKLGWATVGGLAPSDVDYLFGTMHDDYAFAKLQLKLNDPEVKSSHALVLAKGEDVPGSAICSDGKPATGWRVTAMPDWWRFSVSSGGEVIGEDGSFTLSHIVPGQYSVSLGIPTGDGMTQVSNLLTGASLPTGGTLELKINRPSPQSMGAIAGRVKFVGGKPSGSVMVSATSEARDHHSAMIRTGATDFRITPLPAGRYTLRFNATDIEEKVVEGVTAPSEGLEVDLHVIGKPRLVGKAVRASGDEPLKGLRIRVLKVGYLRGPGYVQDPQWREINNPEGTFEVELVGPGIYQVLAMAEGLAPARSERFNTDEDLGKPVVLKLVAGSTLTGTVVDETGKPVDGARVIAMMQTGGPEVQRAGRVREDEISVVAADGQFRLEHLAAGPETLKVAHPDYCPTIVENVTIDAGHNALDAIVMKRGGTVRGKVYDALGRPEAGVTLHVQDRSGYSGFGDEEAGRLAVATTNRDGEYEVRRLPEKLCYVMRAEQWNDLGVVRQAILPQNGRTHSLDLGGPTPVVGQLVVNGMPLADTRVQLGGDEPNFGLFKAFTQTDGEGRFAFGSPSIGRRTLYYLSPNTRNEWIRVRDFSITSETTEFGVIDLRTATLSVNVVGGAPEDAETMRVSLNRYDPRWTHGASVGVVAPRNSADAPWQITQVPPGFYELSCRLGSSLTLRQRIEVTDQAEQSASIEWPAGTATMSGRIDPEAIAGGKGIVYLKLWSKDQRLGMVIVPKEGRYLVERLPAGDYYLTGEDTRGASPLLEFSLAEGEQRTLDLTAETVTPRPPRNIGMLVVRCYTEDGVPLPGCDVKLMGEQGEVPASSNQAERQTFVGAPGNYELSAAYPGFVIASRAATIQPVGLDGRVVDVEIEVMLSRSKHTR